MGKRSLIYAGIGITTAIGLLYGWNLLQSRSSRDMTSEMLENEGLKKPIKKTDPDEGGQTEEMMLFDERPGEEIIEKRSPLDDKVEFEPGL